MQYPNAYPYLKSLSPRAIWKECDLGGKEVITQDNFVEIANIVVSSWGCQSVMIKDYVKSAKDTSDDDGKRFLEVPANDPIELAERAVELGYLNRAAAKAIGSPYITIDVAKTAAIANTDDQRGGNWIILEAGGVSGPANEARY